MHCGAKLDVCSDDDKNAFALAELKLRFTGLQENASCTSTAVSPQNFERNPPLQGEHNSQLIYEILAYTHYIDVRSKDTDVEERPSSKATASLLKICEWVHV